MNCLPNQPCPRCGAPSSGSIDKLVVTCCACSLGFVSFPHLGWIAFRAGDLRLGGDHGRACEALIARHVDGGAEETGP